MKIDWETYEDEYEYLYDEPQVKKITKLKDRHEGGFKKTKQTRHVSKKELWDSVLEHDDEEDFAEAMFQEVKKAEPKAAPKETRKQVDQTQASKFAPRGVNVHTIKNVQIDFDGVQDIQKIQNTYNNKETFGIKFFFKSKNNTFRVIWFNQNVRERDSVYNTEFAYWRSLNK